MSLQLKLTSVQPHIGYDNLANILESNLKMYYDWALLCIGGWSEVTTSSVGAYGGDYSKLRLVDDPNYTAGTVYEAIRKDFIWESNINYVDTTGGTRDPMVIGVPVVNTVPTTQSYHVNYPQGRIIFDNPQIGGADIHLDYSYRYAQIYRADDANWWRELQFNSHRTDSAQFQQLGSGYWSLFGEHRVQLPAIVIETIPRGTSKGWELGSNSKEASRDVLFHIYAENRSDRNNLMDIINLQNNRKLPLFNTNEIVANTGWPLDFEGELINSGVGYEEFVDVTGYRWKVCSLENSTITSVSQIHPNLYNAVIRTTMSVIV